jgi:hypothetical protein
MIRLDVNRDLCPCGSGKLLRECCVGPNNTFRTTPLDTQPPLPRTGFSNPRCYASRLGDCSPLLSREHFISHGILKVLRHGGTVTINGFNWQPENSVQELPPARLASKILCKRHNESLSGLDAMALRLFQAIDNSIRQNERKDRVFLFDGSDFERWLLKTLCGAVFSGNAHMKASDKDWRPSPLWLHVLFDGIPFPRRWGFYYAGNTAERIEGGFKLRTLSNPIAGVYGARISFDDELFLFLMETPPEDLTGTYLERYLYRPKEIVVLNGYSENVIRFVWNDQFRHETCVLKFERRGG